LGGIISGGAGILGKEMDRHKARTERIREKHYKAGSGNVNRNSSNAGIGKHRGTKEEFRSDHTGMERRPGSYSIEKRVPLSRACHIAPREPGVYILYLDGQVMKCGVATYAQGLRWRFTQYYNLNYDDKARDGDYWSVSPSNRDDVKVSWQACPKRVCDELEYKLFRKYGKGPWAKRAPSSLATDEWELLI
jgi:hypothetical protein